MLSQKKNQRTQAISAELMSNFRSEVFPRWVFTWKRLVDRDPESRTAHVQVCSYPVASPSLDGTKRTKNRKRSNYFDINVVLARVVLLQEVWDSIGT